MELRARLLPTLSSLAIGCACVIGIGDSFAAGQSMGAMGDSLSDEYAEGSYAYAKNWVQQLVMFRGVDFGPTASAAGAPGGTWGEPRRTQYEQNWARSGADSQSLLSDGQHTGLASQIVPLDVEYALLAIGANDFAPIPFPGFAYFNIYWNLWGDTQKQNYINTITSRIEAAMDAVLAAGDVNFILANVPDYGVTPIAMSLFPNATNREKVTAVINQLNAKIETLAAEREIVLLDIASLATAIFGTNHNRNTTLMLGNVPIFIQQSDTASNTNPQAGFVHDDIHPHTTLQGIFANAIMLAMNVYAGNGQTLQLFSEAEILSHAGLAYGGMDTLGSSVGDFSQYVIDFSPTTPIVVGDLNDDGVVNVFDLLILLASWGACEECGITACPADLDGDCSVNVFDLLTLLANWG